MQGTDEIGVDVRPPHSLLRHVRHACEGLLQELPGQHGLLVAPGDRCNGLKCLGRLRMTRPEEFLANFKTCMQCLERIRKAARLRVCGREGVEARGQARVRGPELSGKKVMREAQKF